MGGAAKKWSPAEVDDYFALVVEQNGTAMKPGAVEVMASAYLSHEVLSDG